MASLTLPQHASGPPAPQITRLMHAAGTRGTPRRAGGRRARAIRHPELLLTDGAPRRSQVSHAHPDQAVSLRPDHTQATFFAESSRALPTPQGRGVPVRSTSTTAGRTCDSSSGQSREVANTRPDPCRGPVRFLQFVTRFRCHVQLVFPKHLFQSRALYSAAPSAGGRWFGLVEVGKGVVTASSQTSCGRL